MVIVRKKIDKENANPEIIEKTYTEHHIIPILAKTNEVVDELYQVINGHLT